MITMPHPCRLDHMSWACSKCWHVLICDMFVHVGCMYVCKWWRSRFNYKLHIVTVTLKRFFVMYIYIYTRMYMHTYMCAHILRLAKWMGIFKVFNSWFVSVYKRNSAGAIPIYFYKSQYVHIMFVCTYHVRMYISCSYVHIKFVFRLYSKLRGVRLCLVCLPCLTHMHIQTRSPSDHVVETHNWVHSTEAPAWRAQRARNQRNQSRTGHISGVICWWWCERRCVAECAYVASSLRSRMRLSGV